MEQDLASATLLNKFYKKRIALVSPRLDEERKVEKLSFLGCQRQLVIAIVLEWVIKSKLKQ